MRKFAVLAALVAALALPASVSAYPKGHIDWRASCAHQTIMGRSPYAGLYLSPDDPHCRRFR
jgi:hypothetical protein